MFNCVKNIALVSVGIVGGFTACGVLITNKVLESDDCREFIVRKVSDKIETTLFGKGLKHKAHCNCNRASYKPYRDRYYVKKPNTYSVTLTPSVDAIYFETRNEADECLENMMEMAEQYGVVTAAEFYDLAEVPSLYTDNIYGWTYEQMKNAEVVPFGTAFKIKLQKPTRL